MNSEARSREVVTAGAEQEVKPLRSNSLCGDLPATLTPLPRPRSVPGMGEGVCGQPSKENVATEVGWGCSLAPAALFVLGGTSQDDRRTLVGGWVSFPDSPPSPLTLASVHGAHRPPWEGAATCH